MRRAGSPQPLDYARTAVLVQCRHFDHQYLRRLLFRPRLEICQVPVSRDRCYSGQAAGRAPHRRSQRLTDQQHANGRFIIGIARR